MDNRYNIINKTLHWTISKHKEIQLIHGNKHEELNRTQSKMNNVIFSLCAKKSIRAKERLDKGICYRVMNQNHHFIGFQKLLGGGKTDQMFT